MTEDQSQVVHQNVGDVPQVDFVFPQDLRPVGADPPEEDRDGVHQGDGDGGDDQPFREGLFRFVHAIGDAPHGFHPGVGEDRVRHEGQKRHR